MYTQYTHTEPLVQSNYQHCIWLGTFICNNEEIKCKLVFPVNSQSDLSIVRGGGVGKMVNLANGILFANFVPPVTYHNHIYK